MWALAKKRYQSEDKCTMYKQYLPSGSACICVDVWILTFHHKPGQLVFQEIRSHKVKFLETLKD